MTKPTVAFRNSAKASKTYVIMAMSLNVRRKKSRLDLDSESYGLLVSAVLINDSNGHYLHSAYSIILRNSIYIADNFNDC
jgi:hypothetical protein